MCFNSSSSSSSTKTSTQDNRQAADNGATVVRTEGGGTSQTSVAQANTAHTVVSAAPDSNVTLQDVSPDVLAAVFDFAKGVTQGAGDFAMQTQAAYQQAAANANTQDSTQIVQRLMLVGGAVLIFYFWRKG